MRTMGPSQEIQVGTADAQARQPDARIEGMKQAPDLIGIEECQVGRAHHLAESRDIEHRADARVQEDPEQDRPATGRPEPEPERQRVFDQDRAVGHQVDEDRISADPFQVEPVEFTIEQNVMRAVPSIQAGPAFLITHDWK